MEIKLPDNGQHELLSGWKDIAHYLGRGLRTVQRYERELGLPVRRQPGYRTGSVVALKSELDSWVKSLPMVGRPFDARQQPTQAYLISELAKRLGERPDLLTVLMTVQKELETNVREIRHCIAKARQQLNETRKHQDVLEWLIKHYSNAPHLAATDVKHRTPN